MQVRERGGQLAIWSGGERILVVAERAQSRAVVPHPDQFRGVAPAAAALRATIPLGHRIPAPVVALRDLGEYDRLFGAARREVRQSVSHRLHPSPSPSPHATTSFLHLKLWD